MLTPVIEIPFVIVWMTVTVLASTDYPLGKPLPMSIQVGIVGLSPMVIHVEQFREICGDPLFCELKKHIMKYDELFKYY